MPAVSNNSPLIFYAVIGRLELLNETYGEVMVPPAVWRETVAVGAGRPGMSTIRKAPWIRRQIPSDRAMSTPLLTELDAGEAEVIALAIPVWPRITVLLDDLRARRAAEAIGLSVTGSAGALVEAKRLGLIPEVGPILAELRGAGLYLGESAVERTLQLAGER